MPVETPHSRVDTCVADEFDRDARYANFRSAGTDDWLLILTVSGAGRAGTRPVNDFAVASDTAILYRPGTPQVYATDPEKGRWRLLWSHFHPRPHWMSLLNWPEVARGLQLLRIEDAAVAGQVRAALRGAAKFSRQRLPGGVELAMNALERALLWMNTGNRRRTLDRRIRKAVDLMAERSHEPLPLEELARACGLSVSRLAHLFREQVGVAPRKHLEEIRLQHAVRLLRSSTMGIAEIAAETGYANAFYFSNAFKKLLGQSPSAYRAGAMR